MRIFATIAIGLALAVGMPSAAYAKKKTKAIDLSALKKDSVSDYKKLVKGATVSKGLFNVYFNKKTGKVFFEIPQDAFSAPTCSQAASRQSATHATMWLARCT